ncbi:response regulator [Chitinophaga sp. GCM10012297]|uniref:Response regulator n=1 Tax=Chitinophaga chungangae TaxID=2821488 RepID=A0ABS3YCF0_9BACT|nr:response regulator [Chitinophaga chungangae]MBO9152361.1 response regulator [Chitinophaga chungangae]
MKQKLSCLLIDDDRDDQEIFKLALHDVNEDVFCQTADDGIKGLHMLQTDASFTPSYIFLDLNMPRMTGKDCLSAIKSNPLLASIPVVIYSTSSDPKDIQDTKDLGAADYVVKQYSIASLKEILRRYFN